MHLSHTCQNIAVIPYALQQMLMDAFMMRGYLFHDAGVTESSGVELGPLPLLVPGLGGRNQFEVREVA
jgi:hypothetical protein